MLPLEEGAGCEKRKGMSYPVWPEVNNLPPTGSGEAGDNVSER